MILEKHLLKTQPSKAVQMSVGLMVVGAIVAALYDLSFDLQVRTAPRRTVTWAVNTFS